VFALYIATGTIRRTMAREVEDMIVALDMASRSGRQGLCLWCMVKERCFQKLLIGSKIEVQEGSREWRKSRGEGKSHASSTAMNGKMASKFKQDRGQAL
jgi:hypothetical protein